MKLVKNNEQGYTLLIVLLIVTLFMIIGASLMMLNMSGTTKNKSRENNIQAQDLSVKGLDYVVKEIEYKINKMAEEKGGLSKNEFETEFTRILDSYLCKPEAVNNNRLPNTETGSATYCIKEYKNTDPLTTPHLKQVTFQSTGQAGEREHMTEAVVLLGSSANTSFDYTLLTYGNNKPDSHVTKTETTGNIELHGGLKVKGNIYADKKLITSNSSRYKNTIVPSVFPTIEGMTDSNTDGLLPIRIGQGAIGPIERTAVGPVTQKVKADLNNRVTGDLKDEDYSVEQIGYNKFLKSSGETVANEAIEEGVEDSINVVDNLQVNFNIAKRVEDVRKEFYKVGEDSFREDVTPIQTSSLVGNNYAFLFPARLVGGKLEYHEARIRNVKSENNKVYLRGYRIVAKEIDILNTEITNPDKFHWDLYGKNEFKNVAFPKELRLQYGVEAGSASTNPSLKVGKAYIENNMIIGLNNKNESNFDLFDNLLSLDAIGLLSGIESLINFDTPVYLEGTYYVNGNLIISEARLTGNATFFVKGNTTIFFSDIGKQRSLSEGESKFNIISKGPVKFSYISNNHNNFKVGEEGALKDIRDPEFLKKFKNDIYASEWEGHIHSDTKIIMDGATSYLNLSGSMSAPEIELTSIKGRTQPSCKGVDELVSKYVVREFLGGLLGELLTQKIANELINVLIGYEQDGDGFNLIVEYKNSDVPSAANCFEKVKNQKLQTIKAPDFLIKALKIQLIGLGSIKHEMKPRVEIKYNPEPIEFLKRDFNIEYRGEPKITQLDPPKEISRN